MQYSHIRGYGFATNPNVAGSYQGEGSPIGWAYRIQTIIPVYDIMGNFGGSRGSGLGNADNPLAVLYRAKDNVNTDNQFFGSAFADLNVVKGLNLKTVYGVRYDNYTSINIGYPNPERSEGSYDNNPLNEAQGYATEWTWTNTLTYKNKFNDKHDLTLLAGTEAVESQGRVVSGTGNNFFIFGDINYYYLSAASKGLSSSSNGYVSSLFSVFARADYNFYDKYLLSATIRRDGSSNFGPNNRYGNFPAASAAWRVSNENFLKGVSWINDLKLRAGYGSTGNQTIPSFQFLKRYQSAINSSSYPIDGTSAASGIWTSNYDNPDVKWEQLKSWNLGLDFAVASNKIDGSFDWYSRKTTDMLYPVPLPAQGVGGGASPYVNIGSMSNKGLELTLNYHHNSTAGKEAFKFDIGGNISRNVNLVTELAPTVKQQLYGGIRSLQTSIIVPNQPFGAFYGYKITGIYQNAEDIDNRPSYADARIGGPVYADISGPDGTPDGVIDANDRTVIGSPHPEFIYSLSFNTSYRNFDLSMFFNGSQGNDIFDVTRYYTDFSAFDGAVSTRMLDAWSPTNTESMTPSPYRNRPALELQANSYYVQDGSYFRMKLLQIGYSLPVANIFKDRIKNLRIYASGSNLFTVTKYSGLDPEVTQFSSDFTAPGVDLGVYPSSRQFIIGLNATF
ncbi:SusC/RagA family TonB-linked outer membrane protein [Niabella ginsengisoli]|uniref:SusC/RagA family TonB-linked outer membrane protein n=1 Tax=Niabella ginsengisoli TaxID=522298 RepID=A0ABS9SN70_9BACT|nr:SusC/RagA family TonB-linked outer membrane protein [Niabella ginsengisoli]MCH5599726.1 SusC/RagA family TonB-linked outer membrane protein [Niabella ginsengisoli]